MLDQMSNLIHKAGQGMEVSLQEEDWELTRGRNTQEEEKDEAP